jgi:pilus assembly protein Flp/PilA
MKRLINFFKEEDGATAVEYGIMVAGIAAVIVVAVGLIGTNLNTTFGVVSTAVAP